VNEITALDPQSATPSFNLDWGEGASKSGNLHILPNRTEPTNKPRALLRRPRAAEGGQCPAQSVRWLGE